jgi:7-cyano-7-deazaguanine reductase
MKIIASSLQNSVLGKTSAYVDQYDASVLFPIARQTKRDELGIKGTLPFMGSTRAANRR